MAAKCLRMALVVFVVLLFGDAALAAPITWTFDGEMTDGSHFSGWFKFELTAPDTNSSPRRGDYSNAGIDWEFNIAGAFIRPSGGPWTGNFEVFDDIQTHELPPNQIVLGDHFRIYADAMPTPFEAHIVTGIDLFIEDATGALISSDRLPTRPPNINVASFGPSGNGWADHFGLSHAAEFHLNDARGETIARGHITSAVPEPLALLLLGCGLGAGVCRRFAVLASSGS